MDKKLSIAIACGITAMCVSTTGYSAAHSKAGEKSFNIGGDVELDITADEDEVTSNFEHGGRIKLNAVGMVSGENGYFAKGVAQPLVLFNPGTDIIEQNTDTELTGSDAIEVDDLYFQLGKTNSWDLQIGRFEAFNLLPLGKDTLVANAGGVQVYAAGNARGRRDDALHAALHVGSSDGFQFELGVQGYKTGDTKTLAVRPAIKYNFGKVTLHAGYEDLDNDADGFGVGVGANLGGGALNVSYAHGDNGANSEVDTIAANYTKGPWGVGIISSEVDTGNANDPSVQTIYGAYTMPLFNLKDASVTFAASTSKADNVGSNDTLNAAKVRFNYTF